MSTLSVFLVEDNPHIRDSLVPALADLASADVLAVAVSEHEAIDWLGRHKGQWDLVVVDVFLKEGSGLGVVKWCEGREPRQRVVVLTNYPSEVVRKGCMTAGADAFFDKSTQIEDFFSYCLGIQGP